MTNKEYREAVKDNSIFRIVENKDLYPIRYNGDIQEYKVIRQLKLQLKCYCLFISYWVDVVTANIVDDEDFDYQYTIINEKLDKLIE